MSLPYHTSFVRGVALHFHTSPLTDDRPDGPWVCMLNLLAVLPVSVELGAMYGLCMLRDWDDVVREVPAGDRTLILTPWIIASPAAEALLQVMTREGDLPVAAADKVWALVTAAAEEAHDALERRCPGLDPDAAAESRWGALLMREREPKSGYVH